MKFGEKYELLESLTTGGVETFVANDKVRGERVLVHIIEGEAQKPNQPTAQWVLEAFRRVAPEPPGLVLETGRYSGTLYAYLVTKMPDEAALQGWVRLYRSQARETQEIPASPGKLTPESEFPTADLGPKAASPAPGSVTQLFRELDPDSKPGGPSAPLKDLPKEPSTPMEQPSRLLPNVKSALDRSAVRPAAPDSDAVPPGISVPAKVEPNISDPANSFSSLFTPRNVSRENARTSQEGPRPGEFTSFFQGPFRVEGPSETPVASPPQTAEPPRKSVGDFTAMFNRPLAEEPPPAQGVAGNEPAGSGFTGWFSNPNIVGRTSGTPVAPSGAFERSVAEDLSVFPAPKGPTVPSPPLPPPHPASYVAPALPVVSVPAPPIFPNPTFPNSTFPNPTFPNPKIEKPAAAFSPDGATNAFHRPAAEPVPSQPAPPSGPSAYTQIISARSPGHAGSSKPASPNSPASPGFPTPSMPALPAIAPPPMPPAPAMPKIALPPPPKAPKLDKVAVAEPSVSYWPLILTLTVLFFIAALLVLYFVLKH
jgi:hypothetical protein